MFGGYIGGSWLRFVEFVVVVVVVVVWGEGW